MYTKLTARGRSTIPLRTALTPTALMVTAHARVTRWTADAQRAMGVIKPKGRWMFTLELAPPLMGPTMFKGPSMLGRILVVRATPSRATLARWLAPLTVLIAVTPSIFTM